MALVGSILDEKYEVLKKIGQGGMSKVYLAMDIRLNKQWAIKEINQFGRDKELLKQSLIAEVNLMKRLDHPALPRIVDVLTIEGELYLVMDYIEGESLSRILRVHGPQPQMLVVEWAKQLCEVLDYLHTRSPAIIYRDMKPSNIMLCPDGNLKLIDFGIAREYKEEEKLSDTVSLGTKGYAAPEQFGKKQSDPRTDIYCLGVTLHHLITGQDPCEELFERTPIRKFNPELSGGLEYIILKCTRSNPEERYQSAMELVYALSHYEEYDEQYRAKQRKKVKRFMFSAAFAGVFLVSGISSLLLRNKSINQSYESIVLRAQMATVKEEAKNLYLDAITIRPNDIKAYLELIECYKEDAIFSVEENEEMIVQLNSNLSELKRQPEYVTLAFELGKLYWYYYEYGKTETHDNQITRMKSSIPWFEDVITYGDESLTYYNMAKVYCNIGKFNRDVTLNIEEASDKGSYAPYLENLKELLALMEENPEESEIVKLELYKTTMNAIETYTRKLKSDGIEKEELLSIFKRIREATEKTEASTDKTKLIRDYIIGREEQVILAIENAYRAED